MHEPRRVRVVSPCTVEGARFEERADGARFCLHCREVTHDLRRATRSEARALYRRNGGKLCAQVRVGPGGEVRFRPEPPSRSVSVLGGAALTIALAACDGEAASSPHEITTAPETTAPPTPTSPAPSVPVPGAPPPTLREPAPPSVPVPPLEADRDVDHSTDSSSDPADHRDHQHRHAPVPHDEGVLVGGLDGL